MTTREIITEVIGSICFFGLLFFILGALYVFAPYQGSMHNEASYQESKR